MTMECYDEDDRYSGQDRAGFAKGRRPRQTYVLAEIERQLRACEARERLLIRTVVAAAGVAMAAAAWAAWRG